MLFEYEGTTTDKVLTVKPRATLPNWDPVYWGQQAMLKFTPTRPKLNLSTSLAEILREGIPNLWGPTNGIELAIIKERARQESLTLKGKNYRGLVFKDLIDGAAGDYLNYMFGIAPVVSDVANLVSAFNEMTDILRQYQEDAGKGVRRSGILHRDVRNSVFSPSSLSYQGYVDALGMTNYPAFVGVQTSNSSDEASRYASSIQSTVTQYKSEIIRFSGSFSYFLPLNDDFWSGVDSFNSSWARLLGRPLSWETLWELVPWSWFVDWFLGIQTAIAAAELAADPNLVVNYGYVTRSVILTTQVDTILTWPNPSLGYITRVSTMYQSSKKERYRANPFGFTLKTPGGLNPTQWSLLVAAINGGKID